MDRMEGNQMQRTTHGTSVTLEEILTLEQERKPARAWLLEHVYC